MTTMAGTVLAVDDDPDYTSMITMILQTAGYAVHIAADGVAAWEAINKHTPEVVLLDWNMPEPDGLMLLKVLKADPRHRDRYTIMVTARTEPQAKSEGMFAGADDFVTKPFDKLDLLARVRIGVRRYQLQRALIEQTRIATITQTALSVANEIRDPLGAAKVLYEGLLTSPQLRHLPGILEDLVALGDTLSRIEEINTKAQTIAAEKTVPHPDPQPPQTDPLSALLKGKRK